MVSEELERRKIIEMHIQNKIDYLKSTTNGYKESIDKCDKESIDKCDKESIDKCDAAEISSYSEIRGS